MMRLLGVLVGSALAVAALVVFVGIPEFTTETGVAENTVITLPIRSEPAGTVEPEIVTAAAEETVAAASSPEPADESRTDESRTDESRANESRANESRANESNEPPAEPVPVAEIVEAAIPEPLEDVQQWYAFWSPFRSEIAASGFVDQLQRVTGLDYRVVKVKAGVYEVAFAYADDDEITANLSQISAATGLELPGS